MPFPSALSVGNYTHLRNGGHKSNEYLLLGSNTTVFAARVNQATFAASFASVTFDTVTTGAYTDIQEGMTVLISATNDKRAAYFVGRVRVNNSGVVSTSTVLNFNESSATIADNDYLFVIRDYRLFHELGRYTGGVYYKDYARTFTALKPIISGLQSAYAGVVSGSPLGFTVAFAASAIVATTGATISSYAWTIPSGGTVTAGATNTANVTVRFDASATEYWVKLIVTDSGSRTQTRYIPVFAIPADLSTTVTLGANGANIDGDIDNGWSASIDTFAGFTSVLDNTLAVILDVEYYGTTQTSIVSAVKFVGRMRTDTNSTQANPITSVSKKAAIEIEGAAAQMARITTPIITMRDSSGATVWDEITKLTVWRSVAYLLEHSTFHSLYSLSFDSTADTYYAYQLLAPQGNILNSTNDILKSINAALEFAATGEVRAVRNLNFQSSAARTALVTVAAFDAQDWINFSLPHEHVDTVGIVEASGGTYYRAGGILPSMVTPQLSIAPGVAQGNAEGVSSLPGQILTADIGASVSQLELNVRAGNQYAWANGNDEATVDLRSGYNWITPSRYQYYTWTVSASDNTFGRAYTTSDRWWCKSVSIRHNNDTGRKEVNAVFVLETSGADVGATGQTVNYPPVGSVPPILPIVPPVVAYPYFPPDPGIYLPTTPTINVTPPYILPPATTNNIPVDGGAVVSWTEDRIGFTRNFLGVPIWVQITQDDMTGTIRDCRLVMQSAYLLTSDGTNSWVYYTANVFTADGGWGEPTELAGSFDATVPTSTLGAVYAAGIISAGGPDVALWDLTEDTQGGTIPPPAGSATEGFGSFGVNGLESSAIANGGGNYFAAAEWSVGYTNVIQIRVHFSLLFTILDDFFFVIDGSPLTGAGAAPDGTGYIYTWTLTPTDVSMFNFEVSHNSTFYCDWIEWSYSFNDDTLVTRYSTNYGETFAAQQTVGAGDAGGHGMDTVKIGTVALIGAAGQVKKATSGGAWSDYGDPLVTDFAPTALFIPRYQFGSTSTSNATSTPQYLIASSAEDDDGETMYKVTSSGTVFTAITPTVSGDKGLALGAYCIWMPWWSGSIIFAALSFGGSPRLVISTNAGSSWTDKGILDDDALQVIGRRGDKTMQQTFLTNGMPAYSKDRGTSIVSKTFPTDAATEPVTGIQVYG